MFRIFLHRQQQRGSLKLPTFPSSARTDIRTRSGQASAAGRECCQSGRRPGTDPFDIAVGVGEVRRRRDCRERPDEKL
jgi:hypothetical protein